MRKAAAFLVIPVVLVLGCDRAPAPTGEWTPQDHDHTEQAGQVAPPDGGKVDPQQQLAEAAWAQTCAACHGAGGRGDGPNGALVKAPDLTRADWQAKVTDDEIATRIRIGKGLMPANDLPDATIRGLVARIRSMRGP